jgi:hypothetical protein
MNRQMTIWGAAALVATVMIGWACAGIWDKPGGDATCQTASDCPGSDSDCADRTCEQGTCDVRSAPAGTKCGSALELECDGAGTCTRCQQSSQCESGQVCVNRGCFSGCMISGTFYGPDTVNPDESCQICDPGASTSAWSNTLWCWGRNDDGQLGDLTTITRPLPTQVIALKASVAKVAAGSGHTCARMNDGMLFCWGKNDSGQLGNGTTFSTSWPVQANVIGASVAEVVAGGEHTCARTNDGMLFCWGKNSAGQLGDGTTKPKTTPVQALIGTCSP